MLLQYGCRYKVFCRIFFVPLPLLMHEIHSLSDKGSVLALLHPVFSQFLLRSMPVLWKNLPLLSVLTTPYNHHSPVSDQYRGKEYGYTFLSSNVPAWSHAEVLCSRFQSHKSEPVWVYALPRSHFLQGRTVFFR